MKTGKNGKHWRIIALVMIIGLSLFACDNGLNGGNGGNGGGDPLFDDLNSFFSAILENEGNFTVNATTTNNVGSEEIAEIKVAGKHSYCYVEMVDFLDGLYLWLEYYHKNNDPDDGDQWYRVGDPEVNKNEVVFDKDTSENYNKNLLLYFYGYMIEQFAYFADEGTFVKNGNVYTMSDDNYGIVLFEITISPASVSIDLEYIEGTIFTATFTNFNSTSVVLPE